jgi:predicted lipid-binding transport protein (Tim44 family)
MISLTCVVLVFPGAAMSQQPAQASNQEFIYPSKGQTPEQQKKDEAECYLWAVQQSGYDPANPAPAPSQAAHKPVKGGLVKGAAAGAAVGAIGGNNVGNAALKGAAVGGVVQHSANRNAAANSNLAAAQYQQQLQAALASYKKARAACLEGRGYVVK